ncbi:MAG: DEAD/DEAH box helicase [Lachnospiraceae bacterium]|nr:DEAD/DEAH box helicase [Lachnospiraceae bacterium]
MEIKDLILYEKTIPARQAEYADFPVGLTKELVDYLKEKGVEHLYSHQAEMFEQAMNRKNIVITTSTASGKTLSFLLPVLQEILTNPLTRAVFIYPTKALASDQFRAIRPYLDYFGENRIYAGVYDGDTPVNERSRIRKNANIILTNPEMLNGAFLPNHSHYGFDFIFSNLKYVVIDELHTYRGVFGSHVANVFRRLGRICRYYHSQPQFLCSSATIANPVELAEAVCGQKFVRIDRDGSPAAKKSYYLIQPPRVEGEDKNFYAQIRAASIAAGLIPGLVEEEHSFIAFVKSRRNVEIVLREARDKLDGAGFLGSSDAGRISGYRGGYTPVERKTIEKKMISGELLGLVSTNALELGIDIGRVDTSILVGYPGTRASFWQQTGRAGRSGADCRNFLILESLPLDQYIAVNPEWLFENASETAVVDKNNLLIELAHIRAAAAELPLTLDDTAVFPDLGETIPVLLRVKELSSRNGKFAWCGFAFPAGDFSLRNMDQKRYKLMNRETHQEITEMDEMQAFRELHDGAIYMHDGKQYQVLELDTDSRTAWAVPFLGDYYTMPGGTTQIRIIKAQEQQEFGRCRISWGDVNVNDMVYMYKKLQFHNHQNRGYEQLARPLSKDYDTEAAWIGIPENVVRTYRSLLQESADGKIVRNNHFEGMEHAVKTAARMVTMTEQEDIGVSMSSNAIGMDEDARGEVFLFIYDKFVGGLGYAQKSYELIGKIVENAIELVGGCSCKDGCAACIGDYKLDKSVVLWGLKSLLTELEAPRNFKYADYPRRTVVRKEFQFAGLAKRWEEFCTYLRNTGENLGGFLSTISKAEVDGAVLTLYVENEFYRNWLLEESNRKALLNILDFYTEAPAAIRLKIEVEPDGGRPSDLKKKLQRRYENLQE